MKRNLFLNLLVIVLIGGYLASPIFAPTNTITQTLVNLPDEGVKLIVVVLTMAVAWLLLQISVFLKIDLSGYTEPVVAIVAPILVTIFENYLKMIPIIYDNIVLTVIHLVVLIVGTIGGFVIYRAVQARHLLKQILTATAG